MLKADRFFLHETCTQLPLVQLSSPTDISCFFFHLVYNYVIINILIYVKLRSQLASIVKLNVTKYINFFVEILILDPFYMSEINLRFTNNYIKYYLSYQQCSLRTYNCARVMLDKFY